MSEKTELNYDDLTNLAITKGMPYWYAEEAIPGFAEHHINKIKKNGSREKEIKFLSSAYPKLKHKLRYRYEKKTERSLFKNRFRTLLRTNLQNNTIQARTLTETMIEFILGYTLNDLMSHIEKQFTAKMNWSNQGSVWHLDHIYPCSKLKYKSVHDNSFKKLWSLKNLRPLCKIENMKKFNKIECGGENG